MPGMARWNLSLRLTFGLRTSGRRRSLASALGVAVAALAFAAPADRAWSQTPAGKPLTVLVNYDVGGPTDLEARLLARHIGKHLAGKPNVIVQNIGGAAGLIGTKFLGEVAPKDGSMMGYLTGSTQRYVSNPERFTVDFRTYEFIAVVPSGRIHFMRTDVKPGIKTAADIVKADGLIVGGLGRDQPKDMAMRLTLDLLGVPHSYITGYNSSSQAFLALQRGEISYYADSPPIYHTKVEPMVQAGELLPVFYDPGFDGVTYSVPKQMRGMPMLPFHELYQKVKGGMPSGPLWEAYKSLLMVNGTMYRLVAMPPGSPREVVGALREAVMQLNNDEAYLEEAQRIMGEAPEYVSSADLNERVRQGLTIKPELKAFMESYVKRP
jgi:tripartite-type tricarboxylate transporter receptor subunit TctC